MRNCLILGSGRSGTSLVAGILAGCEYDMGKDLYPARAANPKGFFEGPEINGINEDLLATAQPADRSVGPHQRWLSCLPPRVQLRCSEKVEEQIHRALSRAPYCFKDPRFSFTLPIWRPFLSNTGLICVFRHPALTALSIVEECSNAPYLRDLDMNLNRAMAIWEAHYRSILDHHRQDGNWLFVHKDQLMTDSGLDLLGEFLQATEIDRSFPDRGLHRPPPTMSLPGRVTRMYHQLCELAGHAEEVAPAVNTAPDVSVILPLSNNDSEFLKSLARMAMEQRCVSSQLIVVDGTPAGDLDCSGIPHCEVVRQQYDAPSEAHRLGLSQARGRYVAWLDPACQLLPSHLSHAVTCLDQRPDVDMTLCDLVLIGEAGQFREHVTLLKTLDTPSPFWRATTVARRDTLETMATENSHDPDLDIYQALDKAGRVAYLHEPGVCVPQEDFEDVSKIVQASLEHRSSTGLHAKESPPEISVILCSYNRAEKVRNCLAALARQTLDRERYEVVCVNDGSTDNTGSIMRAGMTDLRGVVIDHPENRALAAARNTALANASGRYLLFINDDTYPDPEMLSEHLRAHRIYPRLRKAVLGNIYNRPEIENLVISQALEQFDLIFPFTKSVPSQEYGFDHFITGNVSVSRSAFAKNSIRFDEGFLRYGCEDVEAGYRLHELGYRVYYHPGARAAHDHRMTVEAFVRRTRDNNANLVQFMDMHPELVEHYLKQPRLDEETLTIWQAKVELYEQRCQELEAKLSRLQDMDIRSLDTRADAAIQSMAKGLRRVLWHHMMQAMLQTLDTLPEIRTRMVTPSLAAPVAEDAANPVIDNSTAPRPIADSPSEKQVAPPATQVQAPHPDQVEIFTSRRADAVRPVVSVVIPCFNREGFLAETVESVLQQPESRIEIVMVDDGSTDSTREVAQGLIQNHSDRALKLICQANSGGPSAPRNTGIRHARGRWILPLDSDDKLPPRALSRYLATAGRLGKSAAAIYGKLQYFGASDAIWHTESAFHPNVLLRRALVPATAMFSRQLWERTGGYKDLSYEDWEFWLNCAKEGARFVHVPHITLYYRAQDEESRGKTDRRKHDWAMARIYLQHPDLYEDQELQWAQAYLDQFPSPPAARPRHLPDDPFPMATALLIVSYPGLYTAEEIVWTSRWLSANPVILQRGLGLDKPATDNSQLIAGYGGQPSAPDATLKPGAALSLSCTPEDERVVQTTA